MFITIDESMRDFSAMDDLDILCHTADTLIVRTWKLIESLSFLQDTWWRLDELIPDDEMWPGGVKEFNILVCLKD